MRKVSLLACLALGSLTVLSLPAQADILSCDALKARVDAKLQAKGVPSYTLEIVPAAGTSTGNNAASAVSGASVVKGKEVGTCDGGTKRIIYTKGN